MRWRLATLTLLLLLPLLEVRVRAQTTGAITGTISDASGGALGGVAVEGRHLATGLTRTVTSGGDGRFIMAALPVGIYEVHAQRPGFKPLTLSAVQVTVTADAAAVNTRTSELSYLVGAETIEQLPLNGRNYTDLALLQPGVTPFPHRDGGSVVAHGLAMSVNGQDPRSNVYLLDGTLQNDFTNGPAGSAAGTALGVETVREFRVEVNA